MSQLFWYTVLLLVMQLACVVGMHAQNEEGVNGYWRFRKASIFGVDDNVERTDDNGSIIESRHYTVGTGEARFTVKRSYAVDGKQYDVMANAIISGLTKHISTDKEITLKVSLNADDHEGPRTNGISLSARIIYGELDWTGANWERKKEEMERTDDGDGGYRGSFTTSDNEASIHVADGQGLHPVLKNNAMNMADANSDVMNVIVNCGGMDAVYIYQWISTDPAWVCTNSKMPTIGNFYNSDNSVAYRLDKNGDRYTLTYKIEKEYPRRDMSYYGKLNQVDIKYYKRVGETGKAVYSAKEPSDILYPGKEIQMWFNLEEEQSSFYVDHAPKKAQQKAMTDEERMRLDYENELKKKHGKTGAEVIAEYEANQKMPASNRQAWWDAKKIETNAAYEGLLSMRYVFYESDSVEASKGFINGVFAIPEYGDVTMILLSYGANPVLTFSKLYQWGTPADGDPDDGDASIFNGTDDGDGGIPWVPIVITVPLVGWGGTEIIRRVVPKLKKTKQKKYNKMKQKRGESSKEFRNRRIKQYIKDEGIKHPIKPAEGESFGAWEQRQIRAEKEGLQAEKEHGYYVDKKNADYGTDNAKDTYAKMQDNLDKDLNQKKVNDRRAKGWDIAYKSTYVVRKGAGYTAKVGEWYGKKTGDVRGTAAAKIVQGVLNTADELGQAIADGASWGEGAARVAIKGGSETVKQMLPDSLTFGQGIAAKTGIDTVSNTLIDAVKGKGVKTTKVVKEAVKNLTQNATSDAMGKVIDPDGIGGQAFKQIVDDGRGELVSRVFE